MNCLGFPYCTETVPEDKFCCYTCWVKIPHRLRNELLGAKRTFPGSQLYVIARSNAEAALHKKLHVGYKRREIKRNFTVVE